MHGPGAAVFLARVSQRVPPLIVQHVRQVGAVPRTLIALGVRFVDCPRIRADDRIDLKQLAPAFWSLTIHYGFIEFPNVASTLRQAGKLTDELALDDHAGEQPAPGPHPAGNGEGLTSPWPQDRCPSCGTALDGGPVLFRCIGCVRAVYAADLDMEYRPTFPSAG